MTPQVFIFCEILRQNVSHERAYSANAVSHSVSVSQNPHSPLVMTSSILPHSSLLSDLGLGLSSAHVTQSHFSCTGKLSTALSWNKDTARDIHCLVQEVCVCRKHSLRKTGCVWSEPLISTEKSYECQRSLYLPPCIIILFRKWSSL